MPNEHVQQNDNTFFPQLDDKMEIKLLSPRSHYHWNLQGWFTYDSYTI